MNLFDALGFRWDRSAVPATVPTHSIDRVCFRFHKMLPEYVWDASVLAGNPLTFVEVKTLLDGAPIVGRKISDQKQVLNLAKCSKHLLAMLKRGQFTLSKPIFIELNNIVARKEALEWGVLRGEGHEANDTQDARFGEHGSHTPVTSAPDASELNRVFNAGIEALDECNPFEQAMAFFLFGALQQFFVDGNKHTSHFMMNGALMSKGIDAISVPAAKVQEFNEKMVRLDLSKDATEMMAFIAGCHPDT